MKQLVCTSTLLACLLASLPATATAAVPEPLSGKSLTRTEDPVVVTGKDLPGLLARPAAGFRAYARTHGEMVPIPFQVDEFDKKGRIISTAGRNPREDDDKGAFDANDQIVVMAFDLGDRAGREAFPRGFRAAAEVEIDDPRTGQKGWFYVFDFDHPPAPSPTSYVQYDPATDRVDTPLYTLDFNEKHAVLIDDMRIKSKTEGIGPNLIDRIKARTVLKSRLYLTFHMNEEDITTRVVAHKIGPVRVVRATEYYMRILFLKLTPSAYVDYLFYRNAVVGPSEIKLPFSPKIVLRGGSESISGLDFVHDVYGWQFYTEGHLDPITLTGDSTGKEGKKWDGASWMAVYGKPGGTLMRVVYGPTLVKAHLGYIFFYRDDRNFVDKPEREKGETLLGYYMNVLDFPRGTHQFWFYQYFASPYGPGDEKKFNDIVDHPLRVTAHPLPVTRS